MVSMNPFISNANILIVEFNEENPSTLLNILKIHAKSVKAVTDAEKAFEIAQSDLHLDMILIDTSKKKIQGYELCKQLRKNPHTNVIPVILITEANETADEIYGFEIGAVDFIAKPLKSAVVLSRINTHLEVKMLKACLHERKSHVENLVKERATDYIKAQYAVIYAMGFLAETRENITGNHILRNQHFVKALALQLRSNPRFSAYMTDTIVEYLYITSPLHDIGNVGIPDRILLKPGQLTPDEFEIIKSHTTLGRHVIVHAEHEMGINIPVLKFAEQVIYSHHERWDGSGYPDGLVADAIPIPARIMAIADVYDALVSKRVYKSAIPHEQAVKVIIEGKGTQFDPDIVDSFCEIEQEFKRIAHKYPDSEIDFKKKIDYLEKAICIAP